MKANKIHKETDMEILEKDFIDISDSNVLEYDITKVRGSVRLRTGEFITRNELNQKKNEVKLLHFRNK